MPDSDVWEVLRDAIERKVPKRIPKFLLGADWDFMERFYAEVGFTYEEFTQFKKDKLPFLCPVNIPLSIKLGIDVTWTTTLGQLTWLDEYSEIGTMVGGRSKIVTRETTYEPPEGHVKRPVPHFWYYKDGLTTKEAIRWYLEKSIKYQKGNFRKLKKTQEICEKKYNLIVMGGLTGPWESLSLGIGIGNVAKFWRKDKAFLHEIVEFHKKYALKGMSEMMHICKPKVFMLGDDYGYNAGLMISLEMWRDLVKPTLAEHVKIAHDAGCKFILHSCGNIGALFNDFAELGIDGVESLQPQLNDLISLKQKFGDKIAFLGTIDDTNMLKHSTPEEVKKSVTQSIKNLGSSGYIPGPTNFLLDQPVKNIYAMVESIRDYKVS